jgi:hypothetical protein
MEEHKMSAQVNDRRQQAELAGEYVLVGGRDSFMSGWGQGVDGSYAYWSVPRHLADTMLQWVKARDEFPRDKVYQVVPYKARGHVSVYAYNPKHPAFDGVLNSF